MRRILTISLIILISLTYGSAANASIPLRPYVDSKINVTSIDGDDIAYIQNVTDVAIPTDYILSFAIQIEWFSKLVWESTYADNLPDMWDTIIQHLNLENDWSTEPITPVPFADGELVLQDFYADDGSKVGQMSFIDTNVTENETYILTIYAAWISPRVGSGYASSVGLLVQQMTGENLTIVEVIEKEITDTEQWLIDNAGWLVTFIIAVVTAVVAEVTAKFKDLKERGKTLIERIRGK